MDLRRKDCFAAEAIFNGSTDVPAPDKESENANAGVPAACHPAATVNPNENRHGVLGRLFRAKNVQPECSFAALAVLDVAEKLDTFGETEFLLGGTKWEKKKCAGNQEAGKDGAEENTHGMALCKGNGS